MVFFNYATMQMAAKIVYYGPGLCGKTTNLHVIYNRTAPNSRGEMVSLETETDRTLFFDLLPLDVGVIGGFKTRLQLYTVPGQVFYNTTRKLVLKGVDGIVFVADSQRPMLEPNRESFKNLQDNLAEAGQDWRKIPLVLQYNKRDLTNILTVDELNAALNPDGAIEWYESSAANGLGVFETLKGISKQTLKVLREKMSQDLKKPSVIAAPAAGISQAIPVLSPGGLAGQVPGGPSKGQGETLAKLARFAEFSGGTGATPPAVPAVPPSTSSTTAKVPALSTEPPPSAPVLAPPPKPEAVVFSEAETPSQKAVPAETSVKHVRVRSNVDILSELDKLRKASTQKPPGSSGAFPVVPIAGLTGETGKKSAISLDDILSNAQNHKRELSKSFDVAVPRDTLHQSRSVVVALRFSDEYGGPLMLEKTFSVDLSNLRDVQRLLLSLKFNVQGE